LADEHAASRRACELLVSQHYKAVYRFLAHLTKDVSVAADLTQETFVVAWTSLGEMRDPSALKAWMHRIAYRKFVDSRRRCHRDSALAARLIREPRSGRASADPAHALTAEQRTRDVHAAIDDLEDSKRVTIVLHYLQGLSLRQTASVLDEPTGTTKWRVSQALRDLKAALDGKV
jgi:RNA polymerase sigma-70 factor (ECF subfamily)